MIIYTSFVVHAFLCYKLLQFFKTRIIDFVAIVDLIHSVVQITSIQNAITEKLLHLSDSWINIPWKFVYAFWTFEFTLSHLPVAVSIWDTWQIASVYLEIEFHVEIFKIEFELLNFDSVILLQFFLGDLVWGEI